MVDGKMKGINNMFFNKEKKAMSFVELVVVLAIIGTVAALTIPSLQKYSQRSELGELARKAYLNIEDMVDNAILEKGPMRNWDLSSPSVFFNEYVEPNLRHASIDAGNASLVTQDGMKMTVTSCGFDFCKITVDVNNTKGPNVKGKDIFVFEVWKSLEKVLASNDNGTEFLRRNNWKFTKTLWNQVW